MIPAAEGIRGRPRSKTHRGKRCHEAPDRHRFDHVLAATGEAAEPEPFPGAVSKWEGFVRHDFKVDGRNVIVVEPEKPLPGRPWAWRGEFFGAFPNADIELVKRGWHLAYVGVPDLFGSPEAVARWEKVYDVLVNRHRLSPKPGLIGLSRGALYCMAWAAAHPDKTLAVYLDNGVCDFKSWPGGKPKGLGTGIGSPEEWTKLLKAYGFKDDHEAIASGNNPVDRLKPLADARVPILLVYGDKDRGVPHLENSEVVYERYKALGGPVERVVKPGADHHPHGLTDPRPIVDFFERAWQAEKSSSSGALKASTKADDVDRITTIPFVHKVPLLRDEVAGSDRVLRSARQGLEWQDGEQTSRGQGPWLATAPTEPLRRAGPRPRPGTRRAR